MTELTSQHSPSIARTDNTWLFDPSTDCLFSLDSNLDISFLTPGFNRPHGDDESSLSTSQSVESCLKQWTKLNLDKIHIQGSIQAIIEIPNNFNETHLFHIRMSLQENQHDCMYLGMLRNTLFDDVSLSFKMLNKPQSTPSSFLWSIDLNQNLVNLSLDFEKVTGFTLQDGMKMEFEQLFVNADRQKLKNLTDGVGKSNRDSKSDILRLKRKNGEIKGVEIHKISTLNEGLVIGCHGIIKDITEQQVVREKIDKTLKQEESSKQRLSALLHEKNAILASIPDVIMICNQKGKIIDCKDKNQSEFKNPSEFIGKYLGEIYSQKRTEFFFDAIQTALKSSQPHRIEFRLTNLYDVKCDYDCTITNLQEKKGHVLGVIRNVTENKLIIQELNKTLGHLKRSNEELEQFAFVASHDLQEPTRMIASYLKLLESHLEEVLDSKSREYITRAKENCKKMKDLVFDLLNLSRIEQEPLKKKRFNISELFDPILLTFEKMSREKGAEIKVDRMPRTFCDPALISMVFQNLITNSLKFSRPNVNPKISIQAEVLKDKTIFSVQDNGRGIEEKYHQQVFSMFHRGQNPEKVNGTGIGLALCEKIVRKHGGKIWLKSAVDVGTTVFFSIPEVNKSY